MSSHSEENEQQPEDQFDLPSDTAFTKYKTAAEIADKVLEAILKQIKPGKDIYELCKFGDDMINSECAKVFNKNVSTEKGQTKKMSKGIAFPTCISVDHIVGHYSPLDTESKKIEEGNLVKVDLGVQIDGLCSLVAHTTVAQSESQDPITGRKADVICAAYQASEIAHRLIKPGNKNSDVTKAFSAVASQFKCSPVEGILSHQMHRGESAGQNTIISKITDNQKVEEFEFEEFQAFHVEVIMSTGEGKPKEDDARCTVFKKNKDVNYKLKMKAARGLMHEIETTTAADWPMNFSLGRMEAEHKLLGIKEIQQHDLVHRYPVLSEKTGQFVAQFKFTLIIKPTETLRLNKPQALPKIKSEFKIEDPDLLKTLSQGTKRTKKNKSKKNKKKEKKESKD